MKLCSCHTIDHSNSFMIYLHWRTSWAHYSVEWTSSCKLSNGCSCWCTWTTSHYIQKDQRYISKTSCRSCHYVWCRHYDQIDSSSIQSANWVISTTMDTCRYHNTWCTILQLQVYTNITKLRSFLRLCGVFQRFLLTFDRSEAQLNKKLRKDQLADFETPTKHWLVALRAVQKKLVNPSGLSMPRSLGT